MFILFRATGHPFQDRVRRSRTNTCHLAVRPTCEALAKNPHVSVSVRSPVLPGQAVGQLTEVHPPREWSEQSALLARPSLSCLTPRSNEHPSPDWVKTRSQDPIQSPVISPHSYLLGEESLVPERDLVESSRSPVSSATAYHPCPCSHEPSSQNASGREKSVTRTSATGFRNCPQVDRPPNRRSQLRSCGRPPYNRSTSVLFRLPDYQSDNHCPPRSLSKLAASSARKCINLTALPSLPRPTGKRVPNALLCSYLLCFGCGFVPIHFWLFSPHRPLRVLHDKLVSRPRSGQLIKEHST